MGGSLGIGGAGVECEGVKIVSFPEDDEDAAALSEVDGKMG